MRSIKNIEKAGSDAPLGPIPCPLGSYSAGQFEPELGWSSAALCRVGVPGRGELRARRERSRRPGGPRREAIPRVQAELRPDSREHRAANLLDSQQRVHVGGVGIPPKHGRTTPFVFSSLRHRGRNAVGLFAGVTEREIVSRRICLNNTGHSALYKTHRWKSNYNGFSSRGYREI